MEVFKSSPNVKLLRIILLHVREFFRLDWKDYSKRFDEIRDEFYKIVRKKENLMKKIKRCRVFLELYKLYLKVSSKNYSELREHFIKKIERIKKKTKRLEDELDYLSKSNDDLDNAVVAMRNECDDAIKEAEATKRYQNFYNSRLEIPIKGGLTREVRFSQLMKREQFNRFVKAVQKTMILALLDLDSVAKFRSELNIQRNLLRAILSPGAINALFSVTEHKSPGGKKYFVEVNRGFKALFDSYSKELKQTFKIWRNSMIGEPSKHIFYRLFERVARRSLRGMLE